MNLCILNRLWLVMALAGGYVYAGDLAIEPYLQDLTSDSIKVVWWTELKGERNEVHVVNPVQMAVIATSGQVQGVTLVRHVATVTGLKPDTEYEYYVESDNLRSQRYHFRSAIARDQPFRFAFFGDGRNDDNEIIIRHRAVYKTAMDLKPSFVVYGGDMVWYGANNGPGGSWESFFQQICTSTQGGPPVASMIPNYFVVGNHEIYDQKHDGYASGGLDGTSMARFQAFCVNPDNKSSDSRWRGRYYAFTYGCATFIIMDLNNTSDDSLDNHDKVPDGCSPDWEPGSEQYLWMIEQLKKAQKTSAFTFVFCHPAPFSRGEHGTSDKAIDYQRGFELRTLDSVFRTYGVDVVFTSHDHLVEHCLTGPDGYWEKMDVNDTANLNYLVQGNSGHSARDPHPEWKRWMQIPDAPPETYYTVWFYDWNRSNNPTTVRCSFEDIQISRVSPRSWQATFQVISVDGLKEQYRNHDVFVSSSDAFTIRRVDPISSSILAEDSKDVSTGELAVGGDSKGTVRSVMIPGVIAITVFIGVVVGVRFRHKQRGHSKG